MLALYLRLRNLFIDEEGQDLTEYALLLLLIAIVVIAAVTALGNKVDNIFEDINSKLEAPS